MLELVISLILRRLAGKMPYGAPATAIGYTEITPLVIDKAAGADTWVDWDISASVPGGAIYAEVSFCGASTGGYSGVRKNGSALERKHIHANSVGHSPSILVALDAGRIIEIINSSGTVRYTVWGYWA